LEIQDQKVRVEKCIFNVFRGVPFDKVKVLLSILCELEGLGVLAPSYVMTRKQVFKGRNTLEFIAKGADPKILDENPPLFCNK
jgi:hypothetical protein